MQPLHTDARQQILLSQLNMVIYSLIVPRPYFIFSNLKSVLGDMLFSGQKKELHCISTSGCSSVVHLVA